MMPRFSNRSMVQLGTCDERLQRVFHRVVETFDCTILEGRRDRDRQEEMVRTGKSQLHFPDSKHNARPSLAVDAVPYPIDWKDRERFHYFAGFVVGVAASMGVTLRWGGDWDRDWQVRDNVFDDLAHFEIVDEA